VAHYDAYLNHYDQVVARVLAALEDAGLEERTLVVVTSNHGEELFEAGVVGHVKTYRDTLLRVPLVFSHPSLPAGKAVNEQVQGVDLAPTLLALAGVPQDRGMHGLSLLPWLAEGAGAPLRRPLFSSNQPGEGCYRKGTLKLVGGRRPLMSQEPRPEACQLFQLFDLTRDPTEQDDVCPLRATQAERMRDQLAPWLQARVLEAEGTWLASPEEDFQKLLQERGYWEVDEGDGGGAPGPG